LASWLRKCAHFVEYFIFGLLLFRVVRGTECGWRLRWAITALLIAAVYSGFDEFHQIFVPSQHASPWDSLLDTFGAALAQLALWAWARHQAEAPERDIIAPTR
jgi:VanZ family protein